MELVVYLCLPTALRRCPRQILVLLQSQAYVPKLGTHIVKHRFQGYKLCGGMAMSRVFLSLSQRLMRFWAPSRARVTI